MRFFDFVLGVGCAVIQFYNVLARNVARVGYGYVHNHVAVYVEFGRFKVYIPFERGVRKAVAEGIYNVLIVPVAAFYKAAGFVVTIADVDAFVVFDVVNAGVAARFGFIAGRVVGCKVGERGFGLEVRAVNIGRSAGGVHFAVEHFAERVDAAAARKAEPYYAVDAFIGFEAAQFERSTHVENDYYLVEVGLGLFDEGFFVVVEFKIVVAGCGVAVGAVIAAAGGTCAVTCS